MTAELINTLESPGEFDALTKLRPGEPYFLLIGRDRHAPPLLDQWADKNRRRALADHGGGLISDEQLETELRKSTQAEAIAEAMRDYKRGVDAQAPLMTVEAPKPTYTGHQLPEDTARRDAEQRARARAVAAIHNAVAELSEARTVFEAGGDRSEVRAHAAMIDRLRGYAEHIKPARPGIERAAA